MGGGGLTMSYGYSATTNTFYVMEDQAGYAEFDNWPEDVKPVSDAVWERFCVQGPEGKMRGANSKGLPCWVDIPPPTKAQQVTTAERQRAQWLEKAGKAIAPLQDADDLGIATAKEKADLVTWKKFRVAINRIDPSAAPDIAWPEVPGVA